jgi:anti-anti-sigma factor
VCRWDDGAATIRIDGAFDASTLAEIELAIEAVVAARPRRVTVDLRRVRLMDSAGACAIVALQRRVLAQGGSVTVAGAREQPLMVLKLLRLERLLAVPSAEGHAHAAAAIA